MSIFMLDTDPVSQAASSIQSIATQVSNVSSSVNAYDTSCEDGFDFAGAKKTLVQNIDNCYDKMNNTAKILNQVVNEHTDLQNSLKFKPPQVTSGGLIIEE